MVVHVVNILLKTANYVIRMLINVNLAKIHFFWKIKNVLNAMLKIVKHVQKMLKPAKLAKIHFFWKKTHAILVKS